MKLRSETWIAPFVEARDSRIHGRGLFALRDLAPGEAVSVIGGTPMSAEEFADFAVRSRHFNAIQIDDDLHLVEDPLITARGDASLNHHCDSNLWMLDAVTLASRRSVAAGSELTIDYALFTTSADWTLSPCNCGSPSCRGAPCGTDWQRAELQSRYADHFSPFLNRRIDAAVSSTGRPSGTSS